MEADCLQKILKECTETTFNMISVDGDTSTNDMLVIMANGLAQNNKITINSPRQKFLKKEYWKYVPSLPK